MPFFMSPTFPAPSKKLPEVEALSSRNLGRSNIGGSRLYRRCCDSQELITPSGHPNSSEEEQEDPTSHCASMEFLSTGKAPHSTGKAPHSCLCQVHLFANRLADGPQMAGRFWGSGGLVQMSFPSSYEDTVFVPLECLP